jgi:hypothetical protein
MGGEFVLQTSPIENDTGYFGKDGQIAGKLTRGKCEGPPGSKSSGTPSLHIFGETLVTKAQPIANTTLASS